MTSAPWPAPSRRSSPSRATRPRWPAMPSRRCGCSRRCARTWSSATSACPGMNGIDLLRRIREFDPAIPVIIMTAHGTIEGAVEAVKLGAFDYLKKPVDLEELKLLADRARETSQLKQELSYYRRRDAARDDSDRGRDRRVPGDARGAGPGPADRGTRRDAARAHYRRDRYRQGTGRPNHPRRQPARRPSRSSRSTAPRSRPR